MRIQFAGQNPASSQNWNYISSTPSTSAPLTYPADSVRFSSLTQVADSRSVNDLLWKYAEEELDADLHYKLRPLDKDDRAQDRQKRQEQWPELIGEKYIDRHGNLTRTGKDALRTLWKNRYQADQSAIRALYAQQVADERNRTVPFGRLLGSRWESIFLLTGAPYIRIGRRAYSPYEIGPHLSTAYELGLFCTNSTNGAHVVFHELTAYGKWVRSQLAK